MNPNMTPYDKARHEFVENIGVGGWKEFFDEKITWIRRFFQLTMVILFACSMCSLQQVSQQWMNSGYRDDLTVIPPQDTIPFTNLTICAQVYFNQTFVRENVTIPERLRHLLGNSTSTVDEFYRQFTLFLTPISRFHDFDRSLLSYFNKIVQANPQILDFSAFASAAMASCQSIFKKCWFDGKEFDCCEKAIQIFDDDGICYQLMFNFDSDNAYPSPATTHQVRPGPEGGLSIEASLPLADFPWLEEDAQNGFRIFPMQMPFSMIGSPVTAPHAAETHIKLTGSKYALTKNCTPHGHLHMPDDQYMYYDPFGVSCAVWKGTRTIWKYSGCEYPTQLYRPNKTVVCGPLQNFAVGYVLSDDDLGSERLVGVDAQRVKQLVQMVESDMKAVLSQNSACRPHCEYWFYESSSSFVDLLYSKEQPHNQRMHSIIHVYYTDFGYEQHQEVKEVTPYLVFIGFCNIFILYWGMSVISFVHLAYYVPRYLYALRTHHKLRLVRTRTIRVHPSDQEI